MSLQVPGFIASAAFYFALTALPILCAMVVARRFGVASPVWLILIGLCAFGLAAYAVFAAYLITPRLGHLLALAAYALFVVAAVAALLTARGPRPSLLPPRSLALPLALVLLTTILTGGIGFARSGANQPISVTARERFLPSTALPIDYDNTVPLVVARAELSPVRPLPHPLYNDWLLSDRPPLQAGAYLMELAVFGSPDDSGANYQVIVMLLQSLWILGLWALFVAARLPRSLAALIFAGTILTGFVFLNTLYAWPKLVTAAYLLPAFAVVAFNIGGRKWLAGASVGVACGLALLFHTSALFGLIAVVLAPVLLRRRPKREFVISATGALLVLAGSWVAYQHFGDPPGDRLLKWHLAGEPYVNNVSTLTAIRDAYASEGLAGALHEKAGNLMAQVGDPGAYARSVGSILGNLHASAAATATRTQAAGQLASQNFLNLLPSGGIIAVGGVLAAIGFAVRRVRTSIAGRAAAMLLPIVLITVLAWCLIMFGPPSATAEVHQGSYLIPLLFYSGCIALLWALSPLLAMVVVALNAVWNLGLYLWLDVPASVAAVTAPAFIALALASLIGIGLALAVWTGRSAR